MARRNSAAWRSYAVTQGELDATPTFILHLVGRSVDTMERLILAGDKGLSVAGNPSDKKLADDIDELLNKGVVIRTATEKRDVDFPGHHARYFLVSIVTPQAVGKPEVDCSIGGLFDGI